MKIEFENEPFAIDKWLAGEITVDVGNDLEYKEEIYHFTLFASSDNGVMEVTWTEKTPIKNIIDIETRIKQNYLAK
jgi:hypothetical protein